MKNQEIVSAVEKALANGDGILRLEPAWGARDFLPPGRRLGLIILKFFGPDINPDVPMIAQRGKGD